MLKKIFLITLVAILCMANVVFAAETFVLDGVTYSVEASYSEEEGASNGEISVTAISASGSAEPVASFTGAELLKHLGYTAEKEETMISSSLKDSEELVISVKISETFTSSDSSSESSSSAKDEGVGFIDEDGLFVTEDADEGDGTTPAPVTPTAPVEEPITVILHDLYTMEDTTVVFADQQPVIVEGRTLVPARGVFEQMGYVVEWEAETSTAIVSNDDTTLKIPVGQSYLIVNDNQVEIDVPAQIINSRTMLPLRAISQALGMKVEWEATTRTVLITY